MIHTTKYRFWTWLLLMILMLIMLVIAACVPEKTQSAPIGPTAHPSSSPGAIRQEPGLGTLCTGDDSCFSFCKKDRGRCEQYCRGDHDNELCLILFPPVEPESTVDQTAPHKPQEFKGCTGKGTVSFTSPPMALDDIAFIEPIGQMSGGHVTPIDHGYYTGKGWRPGTPRDNPQIFKEVRAPADGIVQSVDSMPLEYKSSTLGDYRIEIAHTCSLSTIYIHVNQISAKLQAIADKHETVEVKAGEVIGKAPAFDFSVHNKEVTLPGFVVPEHYEVEPWKVHTVDMFASFVEPLRSQLLEKDLRQKEPRGGKIDYDIDGKLVGNWFEENTNGYYGKEEYRRRSGYWGTHLSFAYNGLDPSLIIVSVGDFNDEAKQFAVKSNAPDPATVDERAGTVKYELVPFEYLTDDGKFWDRVSFAKIVEAKATDPVIGTVIVQMLGKRKIKFEVFPGKKAGEVQGFTDNAKIYER